MDINTCFATTADFRNLAMYAHLVPAITTIILGYFVFRKAQDRTKAWLFFGFSLSFAAWLLADLFVWITNDYHLIGMYWAPIDYAGVVFFLFLFAFVQKDLSGKELPHWFQGLLALIAIPAFIVTLTGDAIGDFYQPACEMAENELIVQYRLIAEGLILLATAAIGARHIIKFWNDKKERMRVSLIIGSIVLFMGIFIGSDYLASVTEIYEINLYALFGLPIFILVLTITITSYETFKLGDTIARILLYIFLTLSGAQLFFVTNVSDFIITTLGVLLTIAFGFLLLESFQREAKFRRDLQIANDRLKELDRLKSEFLSIASHQLRAPITAVRGYASNIAEGEYGPIPDYLKDPLQTMQESSRLMVNSIEDYLNISRIEQNRMKYEKSDFDIADLAKKVVKELVPVAEKRKLALTIAAPENLMVNADIGKIKQVITNLVDNAVKYTKQGSVTVTVEHANKQAKIVIADTGIGIAPDEIGGLFEKFKRARGANQVNTTGTGLGLYVAKQLIEGNGGKVRVESDGLGKGSRFIIELPALT